MSELKRIMTSSSITINLIASVLEENNISILIKDHTESARLAGFGAPQNDVDLYVAQANLE